MRALIMVTVIKREFSHASMHIAPGGGGIRQCKTFFLRAVHS